MAMKTTRRISGSCPLFNGAPTQTAKALRVTVDAVDGYVVTADSCWLPLSIAADLTITPVIVDGQKYFDFEATVPTWWADKLDTRAAWQKAGMNRPPMAQRPW